MKKYGGVKVRLNAFSAATLDAGELLASRPDHFNAVESVPPYHSVGGWVGLLCSGEENNPISPAGNRTTIPRSSCP
jgi:hypothetical protein